MTPLFNWNTKQLFLYLEAEYENAQGVCPTFISDQVAFHYAEKVTRPLSPPRLPFLLTGWHFFLILYFHLLLLIDVLSLRFFP